jgi:hypothetical protein
MPRNPTSRIRLAGAKKVRIGSVPLIAPSTQTPQRGSVGSHG